MASRFYFGDDSFLDSQTPTTYSDGEGEDEDTTTLPFPKPLSRPSFLDPAFEPHAFLASLSSSNRFQTLEDLQTELRELSATINRELVDLVNGNYEEFIGLGADLRGGEEKVEDIRVNLLGFEKDVAGLREKVVGRREEVRELVDRKREVRKEVGMGRRLLEIDERLTELEIKCGLRERSMVVVRAERDEGDEVKWSEDWADEDHGDSDDEEDYADEQGFPGRVGAWVQDYLVAKTIVKQFDPEHPFIVAQRDRMYRIQERVRLEVETAIRGAEKLNVKQRLIQMRVRMDELQT